MELSLYSYILIFIVTYLSQIYGSIVGWWSFLNQPLLIFLWLPPHMAVATDISATTWTWLWGFYVFQKKKLIRWEIVKYALPWLVIWTFLWIYFLTSVSSIFIEKFIAIAALLWAAYTLFNKNKDIGGKEFKLPNNYHIWLPLFGLVIWAYVWFSWAGTSILSTLILTTFFGATFLQSIWIKKSIFIIPMVISMVTYFYLWLIHINVFITMFVACLLWGMTGSHIAIKIWDRWVKIIFITVVICIALFLLFR